MRTIILLFALVLAGCGKTKASPTNTSDWKELGIVDDGLGEATIFWTINEETGDRVYALIGLQKGSIFVVPTKKE